MLQTGKNNYLVDLYDEREHEAIIRLFELPFIYQPFFLELGLNPPLLWSLLEIREHHFQGLLTGEVDILGGQLIFTDCGIDWTQSTKYLIAVEVKCAYRDKDSIKSKKSSPRKMNKIQSKINKLLKAGFDKVVLLDIISNPPASGDDIRAWTNSLDMANISELKMLPIFQDRLSNDSPAGHWVWSWGSINGGNEAKRGTGAPVKLRRAGQNPFLCEDLKVQTQRQKVERKLYNMLSKFSMPFGYSVILIDCRYCGKIHGIKNACNI